MINRERELDIRRLIAYIKALKGKDKDISSEVLESVLLVWTKLDKLCSLYNAYLHLSNACPGSHNNFMFTWIRSQHYLECEVLSNNKVEFFYRNNDNNSIWSSDIIIHKNKDFKFIDTKLISPDLIHSKILLFAYNEIYTTTTKTC